MSEYGALLEWYWQRKAEVLIKKTVPVQLCLPQPWHEVLFVQTWTLNMLTVYGPLLTMYTTRCSLKDLCVLFRRPLYMLHIILTLTAD
jgi:hypothetical protein